MKKALIIGAAILIVIGATFALMQIEENSNETITMIESVDGGGKKYTVDLSESVGVTDP
jgi:hypothetical protein